MLANLLKQDCTQESVINIKKVLDVKLQKQSTCEFEEESGKYY